jgi:hypothetical protein
MRPYATLAGADGAPVPHGGRARDALTPTGL